VADGTLIFDTRLDSDGFNKGSNTLKGQVNALKSVFSSFGKVVATAFAVHKIVDLGKQAIETASDIQEVQNVVDTAFGSMAYKMEEFAKTSIETFGISKLTAKQTGSTLMAMARGMGIALDTASDMSISLTALSADMSSFYNVSQDVASTALKSIFTGETETLKRFGIVMTQANLQAFALSRGIKGNVADMNQAQITLLRYQYVMQQTTLAQGDFAKTSDSWANQTRILSERWKELLGIIGNGLVQVLAPVVRYINTALSYLIKFATAASSVLASLFGVGQQSSQTAKTIESVGSSASDASTGLDNMGDSAKTAAKKAQKSLSSIDQLNTVSESVADSSKDAAGAISGMGDGAGGMYFDTPTVGEADTSELEKGIEKTVSKIKTMLQPLTDALGRFKTAVAPFARNVGQGLKWFFENVMVPLGKWTISDLLPAFLDTLGTAIGVVNSVIEVFKPYGLWLWENFLKPIATWTGGAIVEFLNMLTDGLTKLSGWINENQSTVANAALIIGGFFAAFKIAEFIVWIAPLISAFGSFISSGGLLSAVLSGLSTVISALSAPVVLIAAALGLLIISFIDLYNNSESFRQSIAELGSTWLAALQPLAEFVGTVLSDAWNKILKPVIEFFLNTLLPNLITTFKNLWEKVLIPLGAFIGTVLQPVFKVLSDILTSLWKNIVLPLAQAIGAVFKEAWNGLYSVLNKTVIPIIGDVIKDLTSLWKNVINPIIKVLWDNLKPAFDTVFKGIGGVINGLKETMTGIIKFITGVFTGDWKKAWDGVKSIFKGIFDSLVSIVKTPINLIIDIINGLINGIVTGINTVINAVNKLSFSLPEALGGFTVGFNLKTLTAPKIPKLATGAVIPPRSEFMAILGDQKRGVNIEAPLDTIVEAFRQVTGNGVGGNITFVAQVDGKTLFEVTRTQAELFTSQTGQPAFA
jgi:phage-related protein